MRRLKLQFCVGQQIANIEGGLNFAGIDEEVAARALRIARSGFGRVVGQQSRDIGGRDWRIANHDLRNDDSAFRDQDAGTIRQHDDEITPVNFDFFDLGACR